MTGQAGTGIGPSARPVLEIGEIGVFHSAWPERTEAYFASYHAGIRAGRPYFGFGALLRVMRASRRRDHALCVLTPPLYPWWHPRSFLAAFKFTVLRGKPRELYGALVSPLCFSLLRFIQLDPAIAVDRGDSFGIPRHHFFLFDRVRAYFKRELPVDHWKTLYRTAHFRQPGLSFRRKKTWRARMDKLRPIGLGLDPGRTRLALAAAGAPKTTDVFFAGNVEANSTVRDAIPSLLARLRQTGIHVDAPDEQLPVREFMRRCAQAWITLSPEGLGWDCYRHVEAALAGSVPLVSAPAIRRYRPLVAGEQCLVYFPDEDRFTEIVTAALADKAGLARMAASARNHARDHLTDTAICNALFEEWARPDPDRLGAKEEGAPAERTLAFYDANASAYAASMLPDAVTLEQFDAFVRRLPPGGHVLDLGCGAGHYAARLRDAGFRLSLVDGSAGLAAETQARTGLPVRVQRFQDFSDPPIHDGIWASASLLHVPASELAGVFARVAAALKPGGILYCSFKDTAETVDRHGRYYTAMNHARLADLLAQNGLEPLQDFSVDSTGYDGKTARFIAVIAARRVDHTD